MEIYLTFDYELYFGSKTGTVEQCITGPTDLLKKMAEKNGVRLVQFVDVGYLLKLDEYRKKFKILENDYQLIMNQLEDLWKNGHDIQLHIHPHWEDSFYTENGWVINTNRYKLSDWNKTEISDIVGRYKKKLEEITGTGKIYAFRAGGWCIQPFKLLKDALWENGIRLDSSIFNCGYFESDQYYYDFRKSPSKCKWQFEDDPLIESADGSFTEIPITSIFNSPLFYWRLFLLGRLNPYMHKPLGDGIPMEAPGQRFKLLTRWTHNTVSVDGYNASLLQRAYRQQLILGRKNMVIIGHPKALTRYGLNSLEKFIIRNRDSNNFTTFREHQQEYK